MELSSFLTNEKTIEQIVGRQQRSLHSLTIGGSTYEIVPMATDENNMESNLDLLFKSTDGVNEGGKEYYSSIDLLKRLYPEDWESQRTKTALSEKTEIFGPNTQKRILRWGQYKKAYDGRPTANDIKKGYKWPAEQLCKLISIYPGALQDLSRQLGPINWATKASGYINYNSLWLLVNYGRLTGNDSLVKGSNPCVHQIVNQGTYLEGRILQGNSWTISQHFDAAIAAAKFEWMNIQLSQDPWILRLFHPRFRNGLRPDYRRIYSMLMSKAMTAFYNLNGERLNLPQHIHMEISRVISQYCSDISKLIGFDRSGRAESTLGYDKIEVPMLRPELLYIDRWPAPPISLQKGVRGRMNEDEYTAVEQSILKNRRENFIKGEKIENTLGFKSHSGIIGQASSIPHIPFDSNGDDGFELRHYDVSDVSGINWDQLGGYEWTEPTPEGEIIRIDLNDIDFNVKDKRGVAGVQKIADNKKRNSLYEIIRHTIEVKGGEIIDDGATVYEARVLEKEWGWTKNNIRTGIEKGILKRIKLGQYVFQNIDWADYQEWYDGIDERKRASKYRTVTEHEEIGTKLMFGTKEQKKRIKRDNIMQEQGKSIKERREAWAAAVEAEEAKKKEKENAKTVQISIKGKDPELLELEKKEREGTLTEEEEKRIRLKRLAFKRTQNKNNGRNVVNIKKKKELKELEE